MKGSLLNNYIKKTAFLANLKANFIEDAMKLVINEEDAEKSLAKQAAIATAKGLVEKSTPQWLKNANKRLTLLSTSTKVLDLTKEYELIQNKKSKQSANMRRLIVHVHEVETT